jgi:hypothetical protein
MRRALVIAALLSAICASQASAQISVKCFAPALTDCSGVWHRSPVRLDWVVVAPYAPDIGCVDETLTNDTTGMVRGCSAVTQQGDTASRGVRVMIDRTAPVVTGAAATRPADANGWYRSPLQVAFSGTDATSGVDGCTTATYGGPDSGSATVSGTCRDRAGNVSQASAFGLRYDATAPTVQQVRTASGDGVVRVTWAVADATVAELWRSPGVGGEEQSVVARGTDGNVLERKLRNGRRYDYRLLAVDEAGNLATRTFSATPGPRLLAPAAGARVDAPPMLRWTSVRGADYYNVQLFRGRRKLLSVWPTRPRLKLERAWRFGGHRRALKPGRRYRWLVWPGRGKRARNDYGQLIGSATFTVGAS